MRDILFLAHRVPWPPDRGDKIRSWHLLRHLARGARVHVAGFVEGEDIAACTAALSPVAASTTLVRRAKSRVVAAGEALATGRPVSLTAFDSHALQRRVEALLAAHPIDTIVVFSSQMAQYVPDEWPGRLIVDFVDVDSAKFAAYADAARGPMRWLMRREARLLLAHDAAVAARAEASLFVSESEAALFRNTARAQRVHAVENGIDVERFDPATVAPVSAPHPLIVFTGQMDYRPNIDAVTAFADHVLQELKTDRPDLHFDMVRVGIAMYGLNPLPYEENLRPAMTFRSSVALTKRIDAGESVSYGQTWTTDRDTTLALVPVGYADGVSRALSNRMDVWLAGRRRPIVGRVCMDQIVVDCGDDAVAPGEEVVLFGAGTRGEPTATEWATTLGTIDYEIVTGMYRPRVARSYR